MNQRGQTTTYSKQDTKKKLWKALIADQGMMGITISLRIKIRDLFNVEVRNYQLSDADVFKSDGFKAIADDCPNHMTINWYTDAGQSFITCGTETTKDVSAPDAMNRLLIPDIALSELPTFLETLQQAACTLIMASNP